MIPYLVCYRVTGFDHEGWCSDAEGSEIDPETIYEVKFREKEPINKEEFDDSHEGCRTGGSHYCKGCYQNYKCLSFKKVTGKYLESINKLNSIKQEHKEFCRELQLEREKQVEKLKKQYDTRHITDKYKKSNMEANFQIKYNELERNQFNKIEESRSKIIDLQDKLNKHKMEFIENNF
jgi:hypothetical protein